MDLGYTLDSMIEKLTELRETLPGRTRIVTNPVSDIVGVDVITLVHTRSGVPVERVVHLMKVSDPEELARMRAMGDELDRYIEEHLR